MQVIAAGAGADSFSSVTTHNVLSERVNLETATTIETVSRPETCESERELHPEKYSGIFVTIIQCSWMHFMSPAKLNSLDFHKSDKYGESTFIKEQNCVFYAAVDIYVCVLKAFIVYS